MTSQAPTARIADCSNSRRTFEAAPRPPPTSLAPAGRDEIAVEFMPALGDAADHAHGRDRLGIAPACLQQRVARDGKLRGASGRMTSLDLGDNCQGNEDEGAGQCGKTN